MATTTREKWWRSFAAEEEIPVLPDRNPETTFISGSPGIGSSVPAPLPVPQKIKPPISKVAFLRRR